MNIEKKVADSYTVMTQMVMPNDTNPIGNLMGGNLLSWMDVASGICAGKHAGSVVVTAAVDSVSFKHPIKLGDIVTIQASVTCSFNTSIEVYIEVFKDNFFNPEKIRCNEAYYTFVALNKEGKPITVPALITENEKEKKRGEGAKRRREFRLIVAGRLKPENATELKAIFLNDMVEEGE
jgi:acyl-CoA hydrolase